jgi:hypothetical protein
VRWPRDRRHTLQEMLLLNEDKPALHLESQLDGVTLRMLVGELLKAGPETGR